MPLVDVSFTVVFSIQNTLFSCMYHSFIPSTICMLCLLLFDPSRDASLCLQARVVVNEGVIDMKHKLCDIVFQVTLQLYISLHLFFRFFFLKKVLLSNTKEDTHINTHTYILEPHQITQQLDKFTRRDTTTFTTTKTINNTNTITNINSLDQSLFHPHSPTTITIRTTSTKWFNLAQLQIRTQIVV